MASFSMRFFVWVAFLAALVTLVPATPAPIPAGGMYFLPFGLDLTDYNVYQVTGELKLRASEFRFPTQMPQM